MSTGLFGMQFYFVHMNDFYIWPRGVGGQMLSLSDFGHHAIVDPFEYLRKYFSNQLLCLAEARNEEFENEIL